MFVKVESMRESNEARRWRFKVVFFPFFLPILDLICNRTIVHNCTRWPEYYLNVKHIQGVRSICVTLQINLIHIIQN